MLQQLINIKPFLKAETDFDIQIHITHEAYTKLRYYVLGCDTEISGFGKVKEFGYIEKNWVTEYNDGELKFGRKHKTVLKEYAKQGLLIYDIEILPQVVTATHASIDPETIAQFMTTKMATGENIGDYKVWWHSHVDFDAYFSNTDITTIEESTEFPYLISIVMNKKGESQTRLDINDTFPRFSYIDIKVEDAVNQELKEKIAEEIEQKVKLPKKIGFRKYGN